jgi:hypothetical protein
MCTARASVCSLARSLAGLARLALGPSKKKGGASIFDVSVLLSVLRCFGASMLLSCFGGGCRGGP